MGRTRENWNDLKASTRSEETLNPIRNYVEKKIGAANISDFLFDW